MTEVDIATWLLEVVDLVMKKFVLATLVLASLAKNNPDLLIYN